MLEELMFYWQQEQEVLSTKASRPALGLTSMRTKAFAREGVRFGHSTSRSKVMNVWSSITTHMPSWYGAQAQGHFNKARTWTFIIIQFKNAYV
jgi:hypothetical protein